jgi:hypothetical protein
MTAPRLVGEQVATNGEHFNLGFERPHRPPPDERDPSGAATLIIPRVLAALVRGFQPHILIICHDQYVR